MLLPGEIKLVRTKLEAISKLFFKARGSEDESFVKFQPLQFWAEDPEMSKMSTLKKVALMLLSAPAGTAGVERTGSAVNRIRTEERNQLSFRTLEKLLVVQSYLKDPFFSFEKFLEKLTSIVDNVDME